MKNRFPVVQLSVAVVFSVTAFMLLRSVEGINLPQALGAFFAAFAAGAAVATGFATRRDVAVS